MADFKKFSKLVHERWLMLSKHELFVTADQDAAWAEYLRAFPVGSNPIYGADRGSR